MPFQSLSKSLKYNLKKIINRIKYGDAHRLPLAYLETHSRNPSSHYELPKELEDKPFEYYQAFPKLSKEILIALFSSIGVRYVPEITIFELQTKTPRKSFEDFCMTFAEEDGLINSFVLNRMIGRLRKMDALRSEEAFDSRPVYVALANGNLEEVDRLLIEMKKLKNEKDR
ncbi:MAG: Unknown protein [uncultured Sulfurovum sp.]|uniref:Uncharacterized protein n=1 Tax=uncultured Sulfurovum sp. TaxID=269237 RepID=A0A6S6U3I4_9BACT|nr:MAG: Unknown protein [uncultured Sulfurovum sp.]